MIPVLRIHHNRLVVVIAILAVIILAAGSAMLVYGPKKLTTVPDDNFSCNGQITQPDQILKCNLKMLDVAGGLPKHLNNSSLNAIAKDLQLSGQLRLELRQGKITEADFDKKFSIIQEDCRLHSGLSCSEILQLSLPE
jgi:hypothetical protein